MPIKLNLKEKCYLVALYGDIPMRQRERMFRYGSFPAQAGPYVMQDGYDMVAALGNGRVLTKRRGPHPALANHGNMG